jgi:hypothetical protein
MIAFMFVVGTTDQPEPIGIGRATIAIGGPLLLIAAGQTVIEIGRLSRRRLREGKAFSGVLLELLAVLAGVGVLILGLLIVHMIDRNLGSRDEWGLFSPSIECVFRLAVVIGILLLFAAAGRSVVGGAQLSRRRFEEGKPALGGMSALLAVAASAGLVLLSWFAAVFLLFVLLYRQ